MTDTGISRRAFLPAAATAITFPALATSSSVQRVGSEVRSLVLEVGTHSLTANTTIKGDLKLEPGATIAIAEGRTLTILGDLIAPTGAIFTGPGIVDLNRSRLACAHPEWWGATPGDAAFDSLPALQACLRAHPVMRLLAGDYYIGDTLVLDRPFSRIEGGGFRGTAPGLGTRIIVTSSTADVIRAGPASRPKTVNDFPQNIAIHAVALSRSLPVDAAGPVDPTSASSPAGLRAQFLLFADFHQVSAFEHNIGFAARGLVRSTFSDCVAFRSLPGRQETHPYRGFLLDGSRDIGLAGGNASLFLRNCNATIGGRPGVTDPVGLHLVGAFADTFISDFETAGVSTGIRVDGQTGIIGARARNGHINLHIHMPVIDQCDAVGIEIIDVATEGLIDIGDPYVAVAPGAKAALRFDQMRGSVTVVGGQLAGGVNSNARGRAFGIAATASSGFYISGIKILEHAQPVALAGCSGFVLDLAIGNPRSRAGGTSVSLRDCDRGKVTVFLSGQNDAFASGVGVVGASKGLRIDTIGIAPTAVGGAKNRVTLAGVPLPIPTRTPDLIVDGF